MSGVAHDARPFGTLPTIDGYDVIVEATGRPVAHRPTHQSANGLAFRLNEFARGAGVAAAVGVAIREPVPAGDEGDDLLDYDPWERA